jgi:hypothetical protein
VAIVVIALIARLGRASTSGGQTATDLSSRAVNLQAAVFLTTMITAPIAMTFGLVSLTGSGARGMWGAPMLSLFGLLVVALAGRRLDVGVLRRIEVCAFILLIALPAAYAADTLLEPTVTGVHKRQNWPQGAMSERFQQIWWERTGKPLLIVAGSFWEAGLVALKPGLMASILSDGDMHRSPWITADRIRKEGMLLVWQETGASNEPPSSLQPWIGNRRIDREVFAWPVFPYTNPVVIAYVIVPPE